MKYRYYKKPTTEKALQTVKRLIISGRLKPREIMVVRGTFTQKKMVQAYDPHSRRTIPVHRILLVLSWDRPYRATAGAEMASCSG